MKYKVISIVLLNLCASHSYGSHNAVMHEFGSNTAHVAEKAAQYMPKVSTRDAKSLYQMKQPRAYVSDKTTSQVIKELPGVMYSGKSMPDLHAENQTFRDIQTQSGIQFDTSSISVPNLNQATYNAVNAGKENRVKALLDMGANPNIANNVGESLLHIAADTGRIDSVRHLLEAGANPNVRDFEGKTPLHYAAQKGKVDIAQFLLRKGADQAIRDNQGNTSLDLAINNNHDLVVQELLRQPEIKYTKKVTGDSIGMLKTTRQNKYQKSVLEKAKQILGIKDFTSMLYHDQLQELQEAYVKVQKDYDRNMNTIDYSSEDAEKRKNEITEKYNVATEAYKIIKDHLTKELFEKFS